MVEEYNEIGNEIEDMQEDEMEEQAEQQQEIYDDMSPTPQSKEDLYSLFWKVVKTNDSSKVGNLSKEELGSLDLTVRDCQRISLIAEKLGHPAFGKFFKAQGEITLATSSSKDASLVNLFISQQKFMTKTKKSGNIQNFQPQPKKKKGIFG